MVHPVVAVAAALFVECSEQKKKRLLLCSDWLERWPMAVQDLHQPMIVQGLVKVQPFGLLNHSGTQMREGMFVQTWQAEEREVKEKEKEI